MKLGSDHYAGRQRVKRGVCGLEGGAGRQRDDAVAVAVSGADEHPELARDEWVGRQQPLDRAKLRERRRRRVEEQRRLGQRTRDLVPLAVAAAAAEVALVPVRVGCEGRGEPA